jgi:hypothetical protein
VYTFKDMIIRKPRSYRLPTLDLNGKWLSDIGFTIGTMVYIHFQDSCLTLTTEPTTQCNLGIFTVAAKRVKGKTRPQLFLNAFVLQRASYNPYDHVGLTLSHGHIQITKIPRFTTGEFA